METRQLTNMTEAGRRLGLSRQAVHQLVKRKGLTTFVIVKRNGALSSPYVDPAEVKEART